ncbi:MAG TPA: radical SAM protein [Symbiobacteriaceae bacterium]|nr:radical SAM protein [Symbiobacteriaceae bacterium]
MRINEIFRSVQGETSSAGLPTIFIRTGGCNLRCSYCDTPYALTTQGSEKMTVDEVMEQVRALRTKRVCLTGGEPLIQPKAEVQDLLEKLAAEGYEVSIETSGSMAIAPFTLHEKQRWILDMKVPSSGESHTMVFESLGLLRPQDEVKFVVGTREDFDWSVDLIRRFELEGRVGLLFSPIWTTCTPLQLTEWVLESGLDARMQVQLHKIVWHPDTRGV